MQHRIKRLNTSHLIICVCIVLCLRQTWWAISVLRDANRSDVLHDNNAASGAKSSQVHQQALWQPQSPTETKKSTLSKQEDTQEYMSACLLVMDDNHWLIEWLAYHYH